MSDSPIESTKELHESKERKPEMDNSMQQLINGRWVPAIPLKGSWEAHWWSRGVHRFFRRRYPNCSCGVCFEAAHGRYVCTVCGHTENREQEVGCWKCGDGVMVYRRAAK